MSTIIAKLKNYGYPSARECIKDLFGVFINCYIYNRPGEEVVKMAQHLETVARLKLENMPQQEVEITLKDAPSQICDQIGSTVSSFLAFENQIKVIAENHRKIGENLKRACQDYDEVGNKLNDLKEACLKHVETCFKGKFILNSPESSENSSFDSGTSEISEVQSAPGSSGNFLEMQIFIHNSGQSSNACVIFICRIFSLQCL